MGKWTFIRGIMDYEIHFKIGKMDIILSNLLNLPYKHHGHQHPGHQHGGQGHQRFPEHRQGICFEKLFYLTYGDIFDIVNNINILLIFQ